MERRAKEGSPFSGVAMDHGARWFGWSLACEFLKPEVFSLGWRVILMHLSDSLLFLQRGFKFGEVINVQEVLIWKEEFVCVDFNTALATLGWMSVLTCQAVTRSRRWKKINGNVASVLGAQASPSSEF